MPRVTLWSNRHNRRSLLCVVVIGALVALAFSPSMHNQFVAFDDDSYVTNNPEVMRGLKIDGIRWAFTTSYAGNWHPLTWLSHQLDASLYGKDPFGHHLSSVGIHMLSGAGLFLLLQGLTGSTGASALAAVLFAVHPLHVEPVAWVSERKEVLAALFVILAAHCYLRWLRSTSRNYLLLSIAMYALSLLSKPMGVTFPFVLLLVDFWPLGRFSLTRHQRSAHVRGGTSFAPILLEKFPFFLLAAASSVVTYVVQQSGGMFYPVPFLWRLLNACIAYGQYLLTTFVPANLTAFYPHTEGSAPAMKVVCAGLLLLGLSIWSFKAVKTAPWRLVGWLWYLGTLVPVIGFVQVGNQGRADRYTYVPLVGIFMSITWTALAVWRRQRLRGMIAAAAITCVATLTLMSRRQVATWRDNETFFSHMVSVTSDNWIAFNGVGIVLGEKGKFDAAITHFREAVRVRPGFPLGWFNLGLALKAQGKPEAVASLEQSISLKPDYVPAYEALFWHYYRSGQREAAVEVLHRLEQWDSSEAGRLGRYSGLEN